MREEFSTPSGLEIFLGEGGDVELGARTLKHISLFAFDPLTLTLSLSLLCALIHIAISFTCLCVVAINFNFRI